MSYTRQSYLEAVMRETYAATSKARAVLLALMWRSDFDGPTVSYTVNGLIKMTGLHRATVQRALRELEALGVLGQVQHLGRKTVATIQNGKAAAPQVCQDIWDRHLRCDAGIWTVSAEWVLRAAPVHRIEAAERDNRAAGIVGIPVSPDMIEGRTVRRWAAH